MTGRCSLSVDLGKQIILAKMHNSKYLRKQVGSYLQNSLGSVALMAGLLSPVVVLGVGISADVATMSYKRTELQHATDQAAIAAAKELALADSTVNSVKAAAKAFATETLSESMTLFEIDPNVEPDDGTVEVQISHVWQPFLGHYLGLAPTPIVVSSKAKLIGSTKICILTLATSESKALEMNKTAQITANDCGVFSNSRSSSGISLGNTSFIKAESTCSAGGIDFTPGRIVESPMTDCIAIADPLIDRPEPDIGACTAQLGEFSEGDHELDADTFCGGISVSGDATVRLKPGTYVLTGGGLQVAGKAKLYGEHVTIFFADEDAKLSLTGKATVELSGSKNGDLAGLLFFGSRSQPAGLNHNIRAENANNLTGTIYFPTGDLLIDPNAKVAQYSAYTSIVVNTLRLREGPELILNARFGDTDVPAPAGIRSNAQVVIAE